MNISTAEGRKLVQNVKEDTRLVSLILAVGLGLLTFLLRLPFRSEILTNFDAANYVLALEHYDMRLSQPQAPGYPLYILLGRLLWWVTSWFGNGDPQAAMVWLSILFSAFAVAALFLAGQAFFSRRVGLIAALLLSSSTVFWYMAEIVSPYALDLFFSTVVGWLCWHLYRSEPDSGWKDPALWAAAASLGLAGAFRAQTFFFLLPLFLLAAWRRSWLRVVAGLGLAGFLFGLFLIPAIWLSGGMDAFLRQMVTIVPIVRDTDTLVRTTRWVRFWSNTVTIASYTMRSLGEWLLPFIVLAFLGLLFKKGKHNHSLLLFLGLWFVPAWIVYFLIWPGNIGTILVTLPPFFLLASVGFDALMSRGGRWYSASWAVVILLVIGQIFIFAFSPEKPFGEGYREFENYASLRSTEDKYQEKLALIEQFPVEGTLVFSDEFRHLQYYLPAYQGFSMPRFSKADPHLLKLVIAVEAGQVQSKKDVDADSWLPAGVERVIFWSYPDEVVFDSNISLEIVEAEKHAIYVVEVPEEKTLDWSGTGIELVNK